MSNDDDDDNIIDIKNPKGKPTSKSKPNPVAVALDLKRELDEYEKSKDRKPLIDALKEQFLLTRYNAANQSEKVRQLGFELLFERMQHMSDNMLLRTLRELSEMGVIDLQSITGIATGARGAPLVNMQQIFGHGGIGTRDDLRFGSSSNTESNPIKDTGLLLEALEHVANHFRDKGPILIEASPEKEKE